MNSILIDFILLDNILIVLQRANASQKIVFEQILIDLFIMIYKGDLKVS